MKTITFRHGVHSLRYKFRSDANCESLESAIRQELDLPENVVFSLVDLADNTIVSIWSLCYLPNESHVNIKLKETRLEPTRLSPTTKLETFFFGDDVSIVYCRITDTSTSDVCAEKSISFGRGRFLSNERHFVFDWLLLDINSFSDNNEKLILDDLSSSSTTSDTDHSCRESLRYRSVVDRSGLTKHRDAQMRRKNKETRLKCNQMIGHFFVKYGKVESGSVVSFDLIEFCECSDFRSTRHLLRETTQCPQR